MEIPGLNSANNPLRLDPNRVVSPDLVPGKVPAKVTEQKQPQVSQPVILPNQAPAAPLLTKNIQTLSNVLSQLGIPNTPQNNQLAQVLANYGQPVNMQTMTQVARALGPLMQQGSINVEAGVILMINKMPLTTENVRAVASLLSSGGLSQSLLGVNKDLQKLVDNINNGNFSKEVSRVQNQTQSVTMVPNQQENSVQQMAGHIAAITSKENTEKIKPETTAIKAKSDKAEAVEAAIRNPFEEYAEEDITDQRNRKGSEKQADKKALVITEIPPVTTDNSQLLKDISSRAKVIQNLIVTLLSADILKNPAMFQVQLEQLKKIFAGLEVNIKEFKDLLKKYFPEFFKDTAYGEEDSFISDLLQLVLEEEKPEKVSPKKALPDFDFEFVKTLAKAIESISYSMLGREVLTKTVDGMCIPLTLPVKGEFYNVEMLIQREDQSNKKTEVGQVPLRIQLSMETKNMGNVTVDIRNLKKDLQISIAVENQFIQQKVKGSLENLQESLKQLPFDVRPVNCFVNPKPNDSPSILLPQKYRIQSLNRIEGVV